MDFYDFTGYSFQPSVKTLLIKEARAESCDLYSIKSELLNMKNEIGYMKKEIGYLTGGSYGYGSYHSLYSDIQQIKNRLR